MSNFFKNFPTTYYTFGSDNQPIEPVLFQNISAYVGLISDLADDVLLYNTLVIEDYERPDTLSYKLYNTTDYHWTFFFLNHDIRESGWPETETGLLAKAQSDYPNRTITTSGNIASAFLPGHYCTGVTSSTTGTVVKRYLDLGQIIVRTNGDTFSAGESIDPTIPGQAPDTTARVTVDSEVEQYNSVHHYENSSGEYVDIDPYAPDLSGKTPITYINRIRAKNDDLREIKVFKPEVVVQVESEFQKLLLRES